MSGILRTNNSAAIRLLGRLIPLIGRQISAGRRRSGIRVLPKQNQLLARPDSTRDGPEQPFFAVFPRRTGECTAVIGARLAGAAHARGDLI
jgi:hypothetical protein